MSTFWSTLPRPFIGLAPMDGVTDHPFRHIQKRYGQPDLLCTEFVRVERLIAGETKLLRELDYDESQRPILAQVYGTQPDAFRVAALLLCRMGFDGIDINMGCPTASVADTGAGAGLIRTPERAAAILAATRRGVEAWRNGATAWDVPDLSPRLAALVEERHARLPQSHQQPGPLPVSVKTRIGYDRPQVEEWIPRLLACAPAAIAIHGRTLTQGYSGRADWDAIGRAAELASGSDTRIVGNGDVADRADGLARAASVPVDGVLIGRASHGNPFVFCPANSATVADRYRTLRVARQHAVLFENSLAQWPGYSFRGMHKHLGWYVRDVPGARGLRRQLLRTQSAAAVGRLLDDYFACRARWENGDFPVSPSPLGDRLSTTTKL